MIYATSMGLFYLPKDPEPFTLVVHKISDEQRNSFRSIPLVGIHERNEKNAPHALFLETMTGSMFIHVGGEDFCYELASRIARDMLAPGEKMIDIRKDRFVAALDSSLDDILEMMFGDAVGEADENDSDDSGPLH